MSTGDALTKPLDHNSTVIDGNDCDIISLLDADMLQNSYRIRSDLDRDVTGAMRIESTGPEPRLCFQTEFPIAFLKGGGGGLIVNLLLHLEYKNKQHLF